jgi:hypothetical protein
MREPMVPADRVDPLQGTLAVPTRSYAGEYLPIRAHPHSRLISFQAGFLLLPSSVLRA